MFYCRELGVKERCRRSRHFIPTSRGSLWVAHHPQHVLQWRLATSLGSFDQSARSLVARASWSAASVTANAGLKRATSLFPRIVYSVEHGKSISHVAISVANVAR
jgi:hypothetical protein